MHLHKAVSPKRTKAIDIRDDELPHLLESSSVVVRRPLKFQPPEWVNGPPGYSCLTPFRCVEFRGHSPGNGYCARFIPQPFVKGDMLWVRERAWKVVRADGPDVADPESKSDGADGYIYASRYRYCPCPHYADVPSIQLPRWASRRTLEVSKVRVVRWHDITDADAEAEGMPSVTSGEYEKRVRRVFGNRSWDKNEWVWSVFANVCCSTP
ncbi:hypothetical protein SAMN05428964_10569 [Thalassospira xiamenensis]|uniref:Uncharacterized protein n=1 Tax=Thalassospira xiamenensis TaxID=220697 RepID=A0A285TRD4_9PROT|nr:hypothetical protein SAMN05428964_10569 [Thalassospira xiamenensis]